jgi:hypothetical protein
MFYSLPTLSLRARYERGNLVAMLDVVHWRLMHWLRDCFVPSNDKLLFCGFKIMRLSKQQPKHFLYIAH